MPTVLHPDSFEAVLLSSPPLLVTDEQKKIIKNILDTACSDSRFAQKAYIAIMHVLTVGVTKSPTITSLTPSSVEIGDPSLTLHVHGTNFNSGSVIVFNGFDEPTTLVGPTEVTTGINMDVWAAPAVVPISVRNSDGVISDPMNFTFTDGLTSFASDAGKSGPIKSHAHPSVPFNPQDVDKKIELDRTINLPINPHPSDKIPSDKTPPRIDPPKDSPKSDLKK